MPNTRTKEAYTDNELLQLTVAGYVTLDADEVKRLKGLIRKQDAARLAKDPNAKTVLGKAGEYSPQPMDEFIADAKALIKVGKDPKGFFKAALVALSSLVTAAKGVVPDSVHFLDIRLNANGTGWCKLTENWRKQGDGKNKMVPFDIYKGNPVASLKDALK